MGSIFRKAQKLPQLRKLPLKTYTVRYSLDNLVPGVDNVRCDVHLSPAFRKAARRVVLRLMARHTDAERVLGFDGKSGWARERHEFERLFRDMMHEAVNQAKLRSEPQIDLLAQTAVVKLLVGEVRGQFDTLVERFNIVIRKYDISRHQDPKAVIKLKEKLANIRQEQKRTIGEVGQELFQLLVEVQNRELREMRESNFGAAALLPDELFLNPILHALHPSDDFFMIEEYVLLGHRMEDPDKYEPLMYMISTLLRRIETDPEHASVDDDDPAPPEGHPPPADAGASRARPPDRIDGWLRHPDNINTLFNYPQTINQYKRLKKEGGERRHISSLKKRAAEQKALLNLFYRRFSKTGVINRIVASYEMQPLYLAYYPPLVPLQVRQFLIVPKSRRGIINQLKRLRGFYGRTYSLAPLRKKITQIKRIAAQKRKEYLLRFLHGFLRYHRDFQNFRLISDGMQRVNLATSEKVLNLSRANNTLYEFLLPHEHVFEEKPIIHHVIIKADVRGSTDITHQMKSRGLNPASYFSLNFFDPISEILSEYGAVKVFIEGDAIILAILEHQDTPGEWYSVARACGFAINMLFIIHRYNAKSQKYQLPVLELGTGICFRKGAPTFLFDGNTRIMISPAINRADRLSSCSRPVRNRFAGRKPPFNLYVFQSADDEEISATSDDLALRYNVNGIELNQRGFAKLAREIDLREVKCDLAEFGDEPFVLYTGKYPTVSGRYQRLIIREAPVFQVHPTTLVPVRPTARSYYEVCTHSALYGYVRRKLSGGTARSAR